MSLVIGSVILAALMVMITKIPVAYAMAQKGGYDNKQPREQQAKLQGFGLRALAAHQNSIEAFPLFAIGVVLALWAEAPLASVEMLCGVFVLARFAYMACYWFDIASLRSVVWFMGFGSSIWLMALALP